MSFNQILKDSAKVRNHEGADAFRMDADTELYAAVCTMALQPKFYETPQEQVSRVAELVGQVSAQFVAQLAVYARTEMRLRSVPLLLLVELARVHHGDGLVSRAIERTVMRADEIIELLMCYAWRNPRGGIKKLGRLSHQVQVGLQRAFCRFDEYQLAKYDRSQLEVTLRDALFLVHPKAKDAAQQALFDRIVRGELRVPYTWETELSALGQRAFGSEEEKREAFREKWTELVGSGKMGYMALLRNLRNIVEARVDDEVVQCVAARIGDAREVAKARQLPFRYLSAYKELREVPSASIAMLLDALERAIRASAANVAGFGRDSRVLMACDMSGSMQRPLSVRSKVQLYEVGNLLAMTLQNRCAKVVSGIFADDWKVVNLPHADILCHAETLNNLLGKVGYGTNGCKPLEWMLKEKVVVDKVMFFTDCQFWNSPFYSGQQKDFTELWHAYKRISPQAHLYLFDLAGYGHSPISMARADVTLISGWSERTLEMLDAVERGADVLDRIRGIEL